MVQVSLLRVLRLMINFLQGNLNHSRVAQDLLVQYVTEHKVDVALISDPYRAVSDSSAWIVATGTQRAAIWVPGYGVTIANLISDNEFISARLNGVQVYSCYASPNRTKIDYNSFLVRLEGSIRSISLGTPIIVARDFNARSAAWGDCISNPRGDDVNALFG